jgi:hypothetical protein
VQRRASASGHALISTLTARRGEDGHRVFSIAALVGPYAGTMTAIYGWYPNRYGAKDAFRTGTAFIGAIETTTNLENCEPLLLPGLANYNTEPRKSQNNL